MFLLSYTIVNDLQIVDGIEVLNKKLSKPYIKNYIGHVVMAPR